jgi:hypothetical protein
MNEIEKATGEIVMYQPDETIRLEVRMETRALNQAVKRNIERFPEDFMFQLTKGESEILTKQILKSQETTANTLLSSYTYYMVRVHVRQRSL